MTGRLLGVVEIQYTFILEITQYMNEISWTLREYYKIPQFTHI